MADEFQAGICGGNWCNTSRISLGTSPCFGWSTDMTMDMKARSTSDDDDQSPSVCDNLLGFQDIIHKPLSVDSGGVLMDSTLQMLGFGLTSSLASSDWNNQTLLHGSERSESNYIHPSSILQSLFEPDDHDQPQPQQPFFDNFHYSANFRTSSNDFLPSLPKFSPKQSFWNAPSVNDDIRASFLSSQHSQFLNSTFEEKPKCVNLTAKSKSELQVLSLAKKSSDDPAFKRQRIETPSPLPNFKVRKEKLGDRITVLQQLVSPYGKTDTASVLNEAIEYIKFLHDQVGVLSTPYMKNGAHNVQHQQTSHKLKDSQGTKQDLRSRGLCLVPISSTYLVANVTTADFWTPTFGGTYR